MTFRFVDCVDGDQCAHPDTIACIADWHTQRVRTLAEQMATNARRQIAAEAQADDDDTCPWPCCDCYR